MRSWPGGQGGAVCPHPIVFLDPWLLARRPGGPGLPPVKALCVSVPQHQCGDELLWDRVQGEGGHQRRPLGPVRTADGRDRKVWRTHTHTCTRALHTHTHTHTHMHNDTYPHTAYMHKPKRTVTDVLLLRLLHFAVCACACRSTFMYEQFPEVMNMLWTRMLKDNKKNWRRVYKVR